MPHLQKATYLDMNGHILAQGNRFRSRKELPSIFAEIVVICVRNDESSPRIYQVCAGIYTGDMPDEPEFVVLRGFPYECEVCDGAVALKRHDNLALYLQKKLQNREPLIIQAVEMPEDQEQ